MCKCPYVFHQEKERKVMANNRVSGRYFTCVRICESIFLQEQDDQSSEKERERDTGREGETETEETETGILE